MDDDIHCTKGGDMVRFLISIFLMMTLLCGVLLIEGFNPVALFAFTPFIVAIGIPLFASLGIWGFRDLIDVFRHAFLTDKTGIVDKSVNICTFYERLFYLSGLVGTILGFSIILFRINTLGSKSEICRAAAYSLIPSLYGIFFAVIARMVNARIKNR